jgi:hypothetical protein
VVDEDGLDWASGGGAQDLFALRIVRAGIVHKRFFPMQLKRVGSKKAALRIALTPIEIDDNLHMNLLLSGRALCFVG